MVTLVTMAAALASAAPDASNSVKRWRSYTDEAATRCGMPVSWIERVMREESAGRTTLDGRPITSRAGAIGLMQVMPGTWLEMRGRLALGSNPHDPRDNILAGACYLRLMYDRFGHPGLFAAYNAGPRRYADHLTTGRPLPGETRAYLATLVRREASQAPLGDAPPATIFFALRTRKTTADPSPAAPSHGLFVQLGRGLSPR